MQIRKPLADPIILNSHEGEVTAVEWYVLYLIGVFLYMVVSIGIC